MKKINKFLMAGVSCASLGVVFETMSPASAACILNSQCNVVDGSTKILQDATFKSTGSHENKAALVVGNSSIVEGKNLKLIAPLEPSNYAFGLYAKSGAKVVLEDPTITGFIGIDARNAGTDVHIKGGRIDTTGTAVKAGEGVSMTLEHVDVTSSAQSPAIWSPSYGTGANLKIIGGSVNFIAPRAPNNVPAAAIQAGRGFTLIDGTKITSTSAGVQAFGGGNDGLSQLEMKNFIVKTSERSSHGVEVNIRALARLENGIINTTGEHAHALVVFNGEDAPLDAKNLILSTSGFNAHGLMNYGGTSKLENSSIVINGAAFGLYADGINQGVTHSEIKMNGGDITINGAGGRGALAAANGSVNLGGVALATTANNNIGMHLYLNSTGSFTNGVMQINGKNSQAINLGFSSKGTISNSKISVSGENSYGAVFLGAMAVNELTMKDSSLEVADSFAIVANGGTNKLNLENSKFAGQKLIFAGNSVANGQTYGTDFEINALNSQLIGQTMLTKEARLSMNLANGSDWIIRPSADGKLQSELSYLNIDGTSSIVFDTPIDEHYQTLLVGSGNIDPSNRLVYQAGQGAMISLNTYLNKGGALDNQFTDRLLIEGDVKGTTLINIKQIAASPGDITSSGSAFLNNEGISIIQASGLATENSFILPGGYVALNGKPYQYHLYGYGSGSQHGLADENQRLVKGDKPHWDWRLQSVAHIENPPPSDIGKLQAVVPQVPSYLVAPNALFRAGMQDIASLHSRLGQMRFEQTAGRSASPAQDFFIRSYGGKYDYDSNLSFAQYGYDFDMTYQAVQAGVGLTNIETKSGNLRFGINGSYGNLRFEPRQVAGAQETSLDLWSLAPSLTWLHESQSYIDMIVSYGGFKGGVTTDQRGMTAKLSGHSINATLEAGMPVFKTSMGWIVEPQAQLIYQSLDFDEIQDIDGFAVQLGKLDQWTLRAGSEIRKSLNDDTIPYYDISFYGALYLAHTFGDKHQIWLGDKFDIARFGTHLETKIGMQANFSQRISVYADALWTTHLSSGGNSGIGLNSGLKISF